MKKDNTKLVIWAVVALIIGVVIGILITNVTTGNAFKSTNSEHSLKEIKNKSKITVLENDVIRYDFCTNQKTGEIIDYKTIDSSSCNCHTGSCNCGDVCHTYKYNYGETTPYFHEWSTCMQHFIPSDEYYNQPLNQ